MKGIEKHPLWVQQRLSREKYTIKTNRKPTTFFEALKDPPFTSEPWIIISA